MESSASSGYNFCSDLEHARVEVAIPLSLMAQTDLQDGCEGLFWRVLWTLVSMNYTRCIWCISGEFHLQSCWGPRKTADSGEEI